MVLQIPSGAFCKGLRDSVTSGGDNSQQKKKLNPQLLKAQVGRRDSSQNCWTMKILSREIENGPFAASGHTVHAGGQAAHWDIQNKATSSR